MLQMETLASDLAEALALKERMKSGELDGEALDVSARRVKPAANSQIYIDCDYLLITIHLQAELERLNYDDVGHLNNALKNMQQAMKRARKKEGEIEDEEEVRVDPHGRTSGWLIMG